jgi:hypothetical protein
MDDDLQHPPEEISKLVGKLNEGYDVVYGTPQKERHGFWRDIASKVTKVALQSAMGADATTCRVGHGLDRWRENNLPGALHFLEQIYFSDTESNVQYFSMERFIELHKHLKEFRVNLREFMAAYEKANKKGHHAAVVEPAKLLAQFGL